MLRRLRGDAQATSTPQAGPPRLQEVPVETPERLTVADLLHRRAHGNDATRVRRPAAQGAGSERDSHTSDSLSSLTLFSRVVDSPS